MLLFDDAKKLEKAVGEDAAKVIVETLEKYDEKQKRELATNSLVQHEIAMLRGDMKEMELRLKNDLTIRLGAMLAASVGLIALVIRLMLK